jgi:hypothetical protein
MTDLTTRLAALALITIAAIAGLFCRDEGDDE